MPACTHLPTTVAVIDANICASFGSRKPVPCVCDPLFCLLLRSALPSAKVVAVEEVPVVYCLPADLLHIGSYRAISVLPSCYRSAQLLPFRDLTANR